MTTVSTTCDIMEMMKGHGSNFNMSTVMQCVQELKAWQEMQQQKSENEPTMDLLRNEMEDLLQSFDVPEGIQGIDEEFLHRLGYKINNHKEEHCISETECDEKSLYNLNILNENFNSSPKHNSRDNLVILSPNKHFNQCKGKSIDENEKVLKENQSKQINDYDTEKKKKKPYLKKGAGLARYGLNLEEVRNKKGKLKFNKPIIPSKEFKSLKQMKTLPKIEQGNYFVESTRLNLEKVKQVDSWNRYEPKNVPINYDFEKIREQKELQAFEILEERANESNFNASSPSVHQLLEGAVNLNCNKETQSTRSARSLNFNQVNTSTPNKLLKGSDDAYSDCSQECDPLDLTEENKKDMFSKNIKRQQTFTKSNQPKLTENEKKYLENYTSTNPVINPNLEQSFNTELLTKRLEELESEIETFRVENAKLAKLQREFQIERKQFYKSKDDLIKKHNDERKVNEDKLAEEKKKFAKEKANFEKNARELRNKPNKQEREEIKILKEQLAELKEEFNKKESRWSTGQARLRNQVKVLENANTALRSELEVVKKMSLNKKVTFKTTQEKQALKKTKMIHNVNNELSKLTPDMVLSMVDPTLKKVPASILRKPSTSTEYDESSECSSDENQFSENIITNDDSDFSDKDNNPNNSGIIRETVLEDGRKEILYSNGNLKKISSDGLNIKIIYYNGDVKETRHDCERYYFSKNKTYHTTFKNGLEIIEFPNGQIEKHYNDGKVEIDYVNGKKHTVYTDGKEVWNYLDGSVLTVNPNGQRELVLQNGQREIHTSEFKKRIFPDGTTKIVYPDGSQETKYPDGRIRKKDKDGNLTLDSNVS
ncbi:centromere protein J isoform X2 [Adelges cooleyi]|uniref:centromere protein J isoform X2 n=1 Tax=Adelges cooleyi TaxID=133065 RepID=UPI00217FB1E5|nr:centromere protein J isoform X2 [Adelges cooleyi]